jgi:hypothetical protein
MLWGARSDAGSQASGPQGPPAHQQCGAEREQEVDGAGVPGNAKGQRGPGNQGKERDEESGHCRGASAVNPLTVWERTSILIASER